MKKLSSLLLLMSLTFLINCETESPVKQLRIDLKNEGSSIYGTEATQGEYLSAYILYKDFNVTNYPTAKSIKFLAKIRSGHSNRTCQVVLANRMDSTHIEGSLLTTNSQSFVWVETVDILPAFPEENIDLTLFIQTSLGGVRAEVQAAYLYIEWE